MANPEHLAILKKGVKEWNKWRGEHRDIEPDLSKADLNRAPLKGAHLTGVNLKDANLQGADLTDAVLVDVNFRHADLSDAHLNGARMMGANLNGASLNGATLVDATLARVGLIGARLPNADLSRSYLFSAILQRTELDGAIFFHARCNITIFSDVDLSHAKRLETVRHEGPSTIGLDTFFKSKGKIPETFLRGAGVPDIFIEFAASLAGTPFEFNSCFISYSSKDDAFVQRFYADLQNKGVRCWFAPEDLKIGSKFRIDIDEAIRVHDKLLLVLSKNSVESSWVETEVETAFEKERKESRLVLFPIRLDDAVTEVNAGWAADIRRTRHIGDFRDWKDHDAYTKAFERLLRDLKSEKAKSP